MAVKENGGHLDRTILRMPSLLRAVTDYDQNDIVLCSGFLARPAILPK